MKEAPKTLVLKVRLNQLQRDELEVAARKHGMELSTWLRMLGLKEAARLRRLALQKPDRLRGGK